MVRTLLSFAALLALAVSCTPVAVTTEVGYARLRLGGDLSLTTGSNSNAQDVESAFGLGSDRDCPYARVLADFGLPEFGVAGFLLREEGTGVLTDDFGALPAGTPVATRLELGNAKCTAALGFAVGPLTVAPGLLFDVFAIDFRATSAGNAELVDDVVAVPMPFVRVGLPLGALRANAEIGYLDVPGGRGRFADMEAMLTWEPTSNVQLFGGWRLLSADAEGDTGADTVGIDLRVSGWFAGVGLRF